MKFKQFLLDRLVYVWMYFIAVAVVLLIVWLDLLSMKQTVTVGSMVYVFLMTTVLLGIALVYDYLRQRPFLEEINRVHEDKDPQLESVINVRSGVTYEQQLMQDLINNQYRLFVDELTRYRNQQMQHLHFTNQWVHYMKTPVSVINLVIQQSKEKVQEPASKALFSSIEEENERLAHGLEMMLHTARLEKFELDLHPRRVDLVGLARSVINQNKKACIRYSIFPKLICETDKFSVETDEKWMSFMLNQFITNAIKYSKNKPGKKQLTIEMKKDGEDRILSVTDEGIGIAEQDLPRVFDAFFTGENGRIVAESTGMGLYLAKEVAQKLGHGIKVESRLGEGTTISLVFHSGSLYQELT
ncbi:sensor histidine kinase [Paenibacillus larvae]|uniref:sensor histidine kinase n=1 Tax=Paenibacillus larvae TaxID=1464 RepID=UPI002281A46E|nr:sensor histidine kinase [Paenibacillus larvae]MCY9509448.1 sensor histidine kinase [Paenibacillus larvae]MCY9525013.1 sensor histidine kinase [Paenibacillus larvae]